MTSENLRIQAAVHASGENQEAMMEAADEIDRLNSRVAELRSARSDRSIPDHAICFFMDGNKWACVNGDFSNLQESPAGFGDTFDAALSDLEIQVLQKGDRC